MRFDQATGNFKGLDKKKCKYVPRKTIWYQVKTNMGAPYFLNCVTWGVGWSNLVSRLDCFLPTHLCVSLGMNNSQRMNNFILLFCINISCTCKIIYMYVCTFTCVCIMKRMWMCVYLQVGKCVTVRVCLSMCNCIRVNDCVCMCDRDCVCGCVCVCLCVCDCVEYCVYLCGCVCVCVSVWSQGRWRGQSCL